MKACKDVRFFSPALMLSTPISVICSQLRTTERDYSCNQIYRENSRVTVCKAVRCFRPALRLCTPVSVICLQLRTAKKDYSYE